MTSARELILNAKALLLDFDGPMARLMPAPLNSMAAERTRQAAGIELPLDLATTTDHLAIVRHVAGQPNVLARAEAAATAAEVDCARACEPAPWLAELLVSTHSRGIPWAAVTNNSPEAVQAFLSRFDLPTPVAISGRTLATVARMKPDPFYVVAATAAAGVPPAMALFVGDSVSDVEAGRAAGALTLGYASTSERGRALVQAGADALVTAWGYRAEARK